MKTDLTRSIRPSQARRRRYDYLPFVRLHINIIVSRRGEMYIVRFSLFHRRLWLRLLGRVPARRRRRQFFFIVLKMTAADKTRNYLFFVDELSKKPTRSISIFRLRLHDVDKVQIAIGFDQHSPERFQTPAR